MASLLPSHAQIVRASSGICQVTSPVRTTCPMASLPSQVHLLVDTTLANGKFSISAFMPRLLALGDKVLATEFIEMPCSVMFEEAEKVGATKSNSAG